MNNTKNSQFYFAPLEGITGYIYRNAFHETFGVADKYFIPFISPGAKKKLTEKERNDILPEHNAGMNAVPQILSKNAQDVVATCEMLKELGYKEVNLNIGCPSGTVVSKGRGAGLLGDLRVLNQFLEEIFSDTVLPVSIKTRIGMDEESEWEDILKIYNQYPIKELIIHPRLRKDFYKGMPNYEAFSYAEIHSKNPICYNGDINTLQDYINLVTRFPRVDKWMIGRGFLRNPFLLKQLQEFEQEREIYSGNSLSYTNLKEPQSREGSNDSAFLKQFHTTFPKSDDFNRLKQFHDSLLTGYKNYLSGDTPVLFKMKELWFYMREMFPEDEKLYKKVKKAKNLLEYESIVDSAL
ncbi:MAG: tRNA-dihydrouridine synthase family protein [Lachnospiraceae bacterium]|nr:tRNA-dihydrouridine synthase family protein [Lachnospiraceae bacterium]